MEDLQTSEAGKEDLSKIFEQESEIFRDREGIRKFEKQETTEFKERCVSVSFCRGITVR